jgi:hypothetical protein
LHGTECPGFGAQCVGLGLVGEVSDGLSTRSLSGQNKRPTFKTKAPPKICISLANSAVNIRDLTSNLQLNALSVFYYYSKCAICTVNRAAAFQMGGNVH